MTAHHVPASASHGLRLRLGIGIETSVVIAAPHHFLMAESVRDVLRHGRMPGGTWLHVCPARPRRRPAATLAQPIMPVTAAAEERFMIRSLESDPGCLGIAFCVLEQIR